MHLRSELEERASPRVNQALLDFVPLARPWWKMPQRWLVVQMLAVNGIDYTTTTPSDYTF